ncbi:MAG: MFS transporter, partial [Rhizobiales bacterium]|nr:MFS transporter [Hyphomicrobiales bacterium]
FLTVPDVPSTGLSSARVVKEGIGEVLATVRLIRRLPSIGWYLAAHMVYIDGLNTLFIFGPIFAAGTIGLSASEVLYFGIGIYVAAGVGSFAFGWLDDRLGGKRLLLISLSALCAFTIAVLLSKSAGWFTAFAWGAGLFIGPVQSASRSLMARLSPEELRNQLFGLYSLAGKATAPLGPLAVGTVMALTGSQRLGLALTVVWMAIGALLLLPVKEPLKSDEDPPAADLGT